MPRENERPPEWFLTASGLSLYEWAADRPAKIEDRLAALRDAVVSAMRAEFEEKVRVASDNARLLGYADGRRVADVDLGVAESRAEGAEAELREMQQCHALEATRNNALTGQLADAKREGAYEALTKYAERQWMHPVSPAITFRDTHYAPKPAPLVLGGWEVTWGERRHRLYHASRVNGEVLDAVSANDAIGLCSAIAYTPTLKEYEALLALATGADGRTP